MLFNHNSNRSFPVDMIIPLQILALFPTYHRMILPTLRGLHSGCKMVSWPVSTFPNKLFFYPSQIFFFWGGSTFLLYYLCFRRILFFEKKIPLHPQSYNRTHAAKVTQLNTKVALFRPKCCNSEATQRG